METDTYFECECSYCGQFFIADHLSSDCGQCDSMEEDEMEAARNYADCED